MLKGLLKGACFTMLFGVFFSPTVVSATPQTETSQDLNVLNTALQTELSGETGNLNSVKDSYYRTESMKEMTPREKILELKKDLTEQIPTETNIPSGLKTVDSSQVSADEMQQPEETEPTRVVVPVTDEESNYEFDGVQPITNGQEISIPAGLGSVHTYMGWQLITAPDSRQYQLREQAGMNFDSEGFGIIDGRYVIACTTTFGQVGDYIDFYQEDGSVIHCIIGDIKSQGDAGCTPWGHQNGQCIIEFVVDYNSWYGTPMHANPGTSSCHPEWNQNIVRAVNGGSWFG